MHALNARLRAAQRPAGGKAATEKASTKSKPQRLEAFLASRDFTGAVVILEFQRKLGKQIEGYPTLPWLGYSLFHLGEYDKAAVVYREMIATDSDNDPTVFLYLACCLYHLGQYEEAYEAATKGPPVPLQFPLLMHIAFKLKREDDVLTYSRRLENTLHDRLSFAAYSFLRGTYQEALDEYKKLIDARSEYHAFNVYIALCYYKLDFFELMCQHLDVYLVTDPESPTAINLKATGSYRLYSTHHAMVELKPLLDTASARDLDNPLIKHNQVVFTNGERAQQVLPPLLDVIPEARLNLLVYYLNHNMLAEAFDLSQTLNTEGHVSAPELILQAIVLTLVAQSDESRTDAKFAAQRLFTQVGTRDTDQDTIPGRQSMASSYILRQQFEDAILYLESIREFFEDDDAFNYNYGLALAMALQYDDARKRLLRIKDTRMQSSFSVLAFLCRCHIHCREPKKAWQVYIMKTDDPGESYKLVQLIAQECYRVGLFLFAAKAFDVLYRLDGGTLETWEGKRGAIAGTLQQVVAGEEGADALKDVYGLLMKTTKATGQAAPSAAIAQQVEQMGRVIQNYARSNRITLN